MNKVHYNVLGMVNANSKTQIKNALDKVAGVQMVNVDMARGTVEVGYNTPADETQIQNCIRHTGFNIT